MPRYVFLGAKSGEEPIRIGLFAAIIDGFTARHGIIREGYHGVLSAPPGVRPRPFEIILETPQGAPQYLQERALVAALQTILAEYPKLMAYAANL